MQRTDRSARGTRWRAAVLVMIALVSASCSSGADRATPKKKSSAPITRFQLPKPTSAWDKITAKIDDGKISRTAALQAFALQYDVDIPGIEIPSGSRKEGIEDSGTLVRNWVNQFRDELTVGQQQAIDAATGLQDDDEVWTLSPTGDPVKEDGASARASVASAGAVQVREEPAAESEPPVAEPASNGSGGPAGQQFVRPIVSQEFAEAVEATMYEMLGRISRKLGVPTIERGFPDVSWVSETFGQFTNIKLIFSNSSGGNTLMETNAENFSSGRMTPCAITVYRSAWSGEGVVGGTVSDRLRVLIAHEVIHCYQNTVNGLNSNAWIDEGTATWGATNLLGMPEPITASSFGRWMNKPWMQIGNRTYDAVGFWSLAARNGRDLWGNFIPIWTRDETEFALQTIGAASADIQASWAPTAFNRSDWAGLWKTTGVGVPSGTGFTQDTSIGAGGGFDDMRDAYSAMNYDIGSVDDEVLVVETGAGVLGAHDEAGRQYLGMQRGVFCMGSSCVCPKQTKLAGQNMAADKLSAPFGLAFFGGRGGAVVQARAYDLEELCGTKKPRDPDKQIPPAGPRGCGDRCGGSNGDPHLTTMDGSRYDLQAAGEYLLLRDPNSGLQVQARQVPYDNSDHIAINTALAAQLSSHTVTAERKASEVEYRVDGKVVSSATSRKDAIPDPFVTFEFTETGAILTALDGSEIYFLTAKPQYGLQVQISAPQVLRERAVGLLASAGEDAPFGLPEMRDGRTVSGDDEWAAVYEQLAPSWLLSESESILHGKQVQPSDFPGFPARGPQDTSAELRAAAEARCASIEDEALREECVFDVLYGGDEFSSNYEQLDALFRDGADALTGSKRGSGTPAPAKKPTGAKEVAGLATLWKAAETFVGADLLPDGSTLVVASKLSETKYQLKLADATDATASATLDVNDVIGSVVYAAGSIWTAEQRADYSACDVVRRDATNLVEVARLKIECPIIGAPQVYSTKNRAWVETRTTGGDGTQQRALAPIDPSTNALGSGLELAAGLAFGWSRDGAVLFWDNDGDGAAALVDDSTSFKKLPDVDDGRYLVGDGVWLVDSGVARKFDFDGEIAVELELDDQFIFGSRDAVFVAASDNGDLRVVEVDLSGDRSILGDIPKIRSTGMPVPLYNETRIFVTKNRFVAVIPIVGEVSDAVQLLSFPR